MPPPCSRVIVALLQGGVGASYDSNGRDVLAYLEIGCTTETIQGYRTLLGLPLRQHCDRGVCPLAGQILDRFTDKQIDCNWGPPPFIAIYKRSIIPKSCNSGTEISLKLWSSKPRPAKFCASLKFSE